MPSYVIHLACAGQTLKYCKHMTSEEQNQFYLGSIAADMVEDKKRSHFWDAETCRRLVRKPDIRRFLEQYGDDLKEPYVFGYYGHLYLDRIFLERYWDRHFRFLNAGRQPETDYDAVSFVEVTEQNRLYDREEFFSKRLYYGDYDRMNAYFTEKYAITLPDLDAALSDLDKISRVREINWEESLPILRDALSLVRKSTGGGKQECKKPPLNIFLLTELETLIDSAAKEMAGRYA